MTRTSSRIVRGRQGLSDGVNADVARSRLVVHANDLWSNYSGWDGAVPLDMEWISQDWPCSVLDDKHLILWKKTVASIYCSTNDRESLQRATFRGALNCPYRVGVRIQLHGNGNWLLSPLGAIKERYSSLPFLLAAIVPVAHLRIRKDQVLASDTMASVLPLGAWGQGWFLNEIAKCVKVESISIEAICHWLQNPNAFSGYIDAVEGMMRNLVNERIPQDWYNKLWGISP